MTHPHNPGDDRDPLSSIEAEQSLLGALLVNNDVFDRVANLVQPDDFFDPLHGAIFDAIATMIRAGDLATPVTVRHRFVDHPGLEECGGPVYLVRMAGAAISLFACADYASMVADLARRRELRTIMQESLVDLIDLDRPAETATAKVETWSMAQADRGRGSNVISLRAALTATIRQVNEAYSTGGTAGLRCGIRALDEMTGGFSGGDMIVVGGRPSMGKSALAQQIAINVARGLDADQPAMGVGIVSIEMNEVQIALRALSEETARAHAGIAYRDIRNARDLTEQQMRNVIGAAQRLENLPLYVTPPEVRSPGAIMAACRQLVRRFEKAKTRLGLVVIDYMQLMEGSARGNQNERINELSNACKRIARQLGVPVMVLSQLSREVERRDDPRPMLSDLRDSGAIEQDADTVIFPFRAEYYLSRRKPTPANPAAMTEKESQALFAWEQALAECAGKMDLTIAKQRMGAIGTRTVLCDIEMNWIRDAEAWRARSADTEGFA